MKKVVVAFFLCALTLLAVVVNGNLDVLGTLTANIVDFRNATSTAPVKSGTALPPTCTVGQMFFKTDESAGQNIYLCTASNTWTQVSGGSSGGGGGEFNWKPNTRYVKLFTDFTPTVWNQSSPVDLGDFLFLRQIGTLGLNPDNVGAKDSYFPIGVSGFRTDATANNRQGWFLVFTGGVPDPSSEATSLYGLTTYNWEIVCRFRYPSSSDYTNSQLVVGLMQREANDPNRGIGVRFLSNTDTNFVFYTANSDGAGYNSVYDSGVAPSTNWQTLKIRSSGTEQYKIFMSLNGGPEVSVCPSGCNLPRTAINTFTWNSIGFILRTLEASSKRIHLDYAYFWADFGAER